MAGDEWGKMAYEIMKNASYLEHEGEGEKDPNAHGFNGILLSFLSKQTDLILCSLNFS